MLVSDGGDTVKSTTYDQALEQALRNEVMIYSIIDVPIEASAGRDTGRRARAHHPGRADRRQELLCERGRTGQGLCARSAMISARNICWATIRTTRSRASISTGCG